MLLLLLRGQRKALHAIAAVNVGDAVFHKLRSGAMKGLDSDHAGANAWIQLGLIEPCLVDPQCWAIMQTFRCVRESGEQQYVRQMLALLVEGCDDPPANSFTTTLLTRLHTLGWHVCANGDVADLFGRFCLFQISISELRFRVQWAWQFVVAQQVQHRPGFFSLADVDPAETRVWLNSLPRDDQELFKKCLNGCHITQDSKQYCQEGGTNLCPYCECVDSRYHRFWICEHFADVRKNVSDDIIALIAQAPETLTCYGWSLRPWTARRWYAQLSAIPDPLPLVLQPLANDLHIFTDGSCLNQHEISCRIASWAIVRADPGGFCGEVLDKGPCQAFCKAPTELKCLQFSEHYNLDVSIVPRWCCGLIAIRLLYVCAGC